MSTKSKKPSLTSRVTKSVNEILDQHAANPTGFFNGCWVVGPLGEIEPNKFITFFSVEHLGESINKNSINRLRQKAVRERRLRLAAERSRQESGQVA